MHPLVRRVFLLLICLSVSIWPGRVQGRAQGPFSGQQQITVRMIDSRTGILIATSNYLVKINHQEAEHGDWIKKNEDGSGSMTLPPEADVFTVHATYDSAISVYVNCDAAKDRGSADHAPSQDRWYSIATVLASGVVAPNDCVGKKVPEKLQVVAKPGEFVFFVRPLNAREQFAN
jgi:hypothetical protein